MTAAAATLCAEGGGGVAGRRGKSDGKWGPGRGLPMVGAEGGPRNTPIIPEIWKLLFFFSWLKTIDFFSTDFWSPVSRGKDTKEQKRPSNNFISNGPYLNQDLLGGWRTYIYCFLWQFPLLSSILKNRKHIYWNTWLTVWQQLWDFGWYPWQYSAAKSTVLASTDGHFVGI